MRYETGTFELRDNDTMMRELSSAELDMVSGGQTIAAHLTPNATGVLLGIFGSNFALASLVITPLAPFTTPVIADLSASVP